MGFYGTTSVPQLGNIKQEEVLLCLTGAMRSQAQSHRPFIEHFHKLYLGLLSLVHFSYREKKRFRLVCLFNHLFAPANTNRPTTAPDWLLMITEPTVRLDSGPVVETRRFPFIFSETPPRGGAAGDDKTTPGSTLLSLQSAPHYDLYTGNQISGTTAPKYPHCTRHRL